jgi:uncharacterized protein YkwD
MKKNNQSYLLIAAAITLTSLPLGSGLTRATLSPTTIPMQNSNLKPSTWTTQPHTPQLIAQANPSYSNQLLNLINAERRKVGALPLRINSKLTQAALGQSQDMATHNFFSHTGSNGSQLSARISGTGYRWSAVAENIAAGQSTPSQVFQSWLNSPPHKQSMLDPKYKEVGFGYASNSKSTYKTYWTANFAKPR